MFWALEAVPKIVLTSPRLRIASMTKAWEAPNPAPGRVAPRWARSPNVSLNTMLAG